MLWLPLVLRSQLLYGVMLGVLFGSFTDNQPGSLARILSGLAALPVALLWVCDAIMRWLSSRRLRTLKKKTRSGRDSAEPGA